MAFLTGLVRFSFVKVLQPELDEKTGKEKYSLMLLIPKSDDVTYQRFQEAYDEACAIGKATKWNGKIPPAVKFPLRDGDIEKPDYPEFHDMWFVNASSVFQPGIVDEKNQELIDTKRVYSGVWGKASLELYPYTVPGPGGKGVSGWGVATGLRNLKIVRDDTKLGASRESAEDAFKDDDEEEW